MDNSKTLSVERTVNRFGTMYALNLISLIVSASILVLWHVMWLITWTMGYLGSYWWSGFILILFFALVMLSSLYCFIKSKRLSSSCSDIDECADDNEKKVKIAKNLMAQSWTNKTGTKSFRTADIFWSYALFEIFGTIIMFLLLWVHIQSIQLLTLFEQMSEFAIAFIVISIVCLITPRILTWTGIGIFAKTCRDVGQHYNAIITARQQEEEADRKLVDEARKMEYDVKHLLAESGFKFFLKYYPQLVRMGVRDVNVEEDYSPTEKEERLKAAKKLIDSGLASAAAQQILEKFPDLLSREEKELALRIIG